MNEQEKPSVLENTEKIPKKCLFIDDHPLIIAGIKGLFEESDNFVAVECHSVDEALNAIRANNPDIIFLDHSLTRDGSEGIEIADQIKKEKPEIEIYLTTSNPNNQKQYEMIGIKHINKDNFTELQKIVTS